MKKITSILLSLLLAAASATMLFGCGDDDKKPADTTAATTVESDAEEETSAESTAPIENVPELEPNPVIAAYIEAHRDELITALETSVTSGSGLTCKSDIKAVGSGFVADILINELSYLDPATKKNLQSSYDALGSVFEKSLKDIQVSLPELSYFKLNVCDKNGDVIAVVLAGEEK